MAYTVRKNLVIDQVDGTSMVYGICPFTDKTYQVIVNTVALRKFANGERVQNCFPEMDRGNREFLISGISPEGWRKMFGDE
jgi:hypothetical protein